MAQPEPRLFGAKIDGGPQSVVNMMNAMSFIGRNEGGCSGYWRLRQGSSDNHISQTVITGFSQQARIGRLSSCDGG